MPRNAATFYTDGARLKSLMLDQYSDDAWDWISEKPKTKDEELYSRVAAVYRAANMAADGLASLPFAVVKGETDVDHSDDWQNKVGFMPNPRELIRLWRLSLFMSNTAYGFMESSRGSKLLRYIIPSTITPVVDSRNGLTGFKRKLGTQTLEYSVGQRRIFYAWRLDHTTELLPSENTEFQALMAAGGVLYFADYYVRHFFERGGIKPTLLMVKGVPNPQERERIENIWDKIIRGAYKYLGKVFNAESMETHVIGEGIDNLRDSNLHQEKLADIAMAAGMPLSLLLANSANYATAQVEYNQWFRHSIIPWSVFLEDAMNTQLFEPLGLHFEFRPEMTDQGQEEEVERANAYASYVNAGMKPSIAAQIVGIDLPQDIEYADLDPVEEEETESSTDVETEEVEEEDTAKFIPTLDQVKEVALWESFAFRKLKRGEPMDFDFTVKTLPEAYAEAVRQKLAASTDYNSVREAFTLDGMTLTPEPEYEQATTPLAPDIKELAEALNRAADVKEPQVVNVYIDNHPVEKPGAIIGTEEV